MGVVIVVILSVLLVTTLVTMITFIDQQSGIEYKVSKNLSLYNGSGIVFVLLMWFISPNLVGINSYLAGVLLMHFMVIALRK